MEQSATTRDTPRWVQQWEADRESGLRVYLLRIGLVYYGITLSLTLAVIHATRPEFILALYLRDTVLAIAAGLLLAALSWFWRGAWYNHYTSTPTHPRGVNR